ncbi:CG43729 [Drosophila busckii]|uniref:CG43729 n=1 Tax=Drosophila busckii TaxID=30019 RepID=A0A0M5IZW1_DROBS|nr:uncharacterized protein LOC108596137 [Drosophila busckii]ALC41386.1 CG43729 [Drosophila busckii]
MQTSRAAGAGDKTKRRIRIVVTDNNNLASAPPPPSAPSAPPLHTSTHTQSHSPSHETKRLNIEYSDNDSGLIWDTDKDILILSGRNKNDKNWENWERIREQKLEKMKNICFESYRQSKRDKSLVKPKPKQLDSTWYTDNIYSNRSDDYDEDYVPDCLKYGSYSNRILRDIREQDEKYAEDGQPMRERRGEGEGSPGYGLQRSKSCKEFQYPKSQSCCFEGNVYEVGQGAAATTGTTSILKNRSGVPKSYSFSASTKTMPFDIIDYELPPASNTRRDKREAYRRSMQLLYSNSLDSHGHGHSCCAREQCTSAKCLLDDIYAGARGAAAGRGSNRQLSRQLRSPADWLFEEEQQQLRRSQRQQQQQQQVVCCCASDDYCCHRQPPAPQRLARRAPPPPHCPGHHPAAEEEEHMHCRYDTELEQLIRAERDRLLLQDKFLDDDERYLAHSPSRRHYAPPYARPVRSKSLLEMQPPSLFDEDSCSDTTEIDLEDFNIDLEKYWEQLDKPPSPIDMDMRRNMHSNLKVKNVNVRCYNNGQPIDMVDREHERLMIKKSLLEGMPSPPQLDASGAFFEHNAAAALQQQERLPPSYGYGHKIYPTVDTLPTYQYNNFYPEHQLGGNVLTQQPTAGIHHASAGGHSALSLINNIFSIYKPNKYSPENCQLNYESKPEPCKKMNMPSTRRPLGGASSCHGPEYLHSSMKRPLLVSTEQPHFKIIPEKTGLKISPLLAYDEYGGDKSQHRLSSTARPLMLPH